MARPWIRLYTDSRHKAKLQRLPDHLFKFLINCWTATADNDDELPAVADLAWDLRIDEDLCGSYVAHLMSIGLLDQIEDKVLPHNWLDRQFLSDISTERVRQFRQRRVKRRETLHETAQEQNRTDTEQTQNRAEPVMTPSLDEQFQEYKRLFEIVGNPIPEDFANGSFCWRAWCVLDYNQRAAAVESLREHERAGDPVLHNPDNYLTKGGYKRGIRKVLNGNSRHDQIRRAMEEA